jgi:hypothetical protein
MTTSHPTPEACLAFHVLKTYEDWLGQPSPSLLSTLLFGAATRAVLTNSQIPTWRVYGPLTLPSFSTPLVTQTGHPLLTINWASALELIHFSLTDAMQALLSSMLTWIQEHGFTFADADIISGQPDPAGLDGLLQHLARRPGMYLGHTSGWALHCFLTGMDRGGDWLDLPPIPRLRAIIAEIAAHSIKSYGSPFAAYSVYASSPSTLLSWAGIEPTSSFTHEQLLSQKLSY